MKSFNSQTSCAIIILLLFLFYKQVISGSNGYEEVIREKREPPTRNPNRADDFLITQKGQIVLAVVFGVTGYLCCVILPCCLGACSIFLLYCMNLVEYPDTPVKRKQTAYANTEKQVTNEENTPNKVIEHSQFIASTQDPVTGAMLSNQITDPEHFYYPMQTESLYPYLPYQLSYVQQGAQANKLNFTNPMYNNTQESEIENFYHIVPEPGFKTGTVNKTDDI